MEHAGNGAGVPAVACRLAELAARSKNPEPHRRGVGRSSGRFRLQAVCFTVTVAFARTCIPEMGRSSKIHGALPIHAEACRCMPGSKRCIRACGLLGDRWRAYTKERAECEAMQAAAVRRWHSSALWGAFRSWLNAVAWHRHLSAASADATARWRCRLLTEVSTCRIHLQAAFTRTLPSMLSLTTPDRTSFPILLHELWLRRSWIGCTGTALSC